MMEESRGMMDGLVFVLMAVTDALVEMVVLPAQEWFAKRSAVTTTMSGSANKQGTVNGDMPITGAAGVEDRVRTNLCQN